MKITEANSTQDFSEIKRGPHQRMSADSICPAIHLRESPAQMILIHRMPEIKESNSHSKFARVHLLNGDVLATS